MLTSEERLKLSIQSAEGLATGDAYGNHHGTNQRKRQAEYWHYTDDTLMTLSILQILRVYSEINQDALAQSFAKHFDGNRGYGQGVTRLLKKIKHGHSWHTTSQAMFNNSGSYGNGSAMRVMPIGAYFYDDLNIVVEQARLSSEVTHAHPEGIAGAIAVAIATALAYRYYLSKEAPVFADFLHSIIDYTPTSIVRDKLITAQSLGEKAKPYKVAQELGNGRPSLAMLTVPFAIWSAITHIDNFETAIRKTAGVMGDVDTNCAIVGGIVVMYTGLNNIPSSWQNRREALLEWAVL